MGGQDLLNFLTKSLARFAFYRADTLDICPGLQEVPYQTRFSLGGEDEDELDAYLARESAKTARRDRTAGDPRRRCEENIMAGATEGQTQVTGTPCADSAVETFILTRHQKNTVAAIYTAFLIERAWRAAHAGVILGGEFERAKYARQLDAEGRLLPTAQLPYVTYKDFLHWHDRVVLAGRQR